MTANAGKLLLLKIESVTPGTYTTVGGFRSNGLTINGEAIDVTDKDSAGWKELLDGGGIKSMAMSGAGVFKDSAGEEAIRVEAFAGTLHNYQMTFGNGDTLVGAFQITSYERTGEHAGEETFSISLEGSGAPTWA